ncbi:ribosome-associated translation inhibitor RaiA [Candidatus Nomurabacteria bacterium]|nr:ribosome-associated translation inhibitor RaiA [Candidatus Nomurabacteria bacterium]
MQINIQSKNIELTEEIRDYALKRVTNLEKLLSNIKEEKGGEVKVSFEISKTTNHHKAGEVFHSDCSIIIDGKNFYAGSDNEDLMSAIDEVKEKLFNEISKDKDKKQTLFRRGASSVKKMLKGLSKRNPFTSKY